ncbi:MAG: MBL fold metallo-hydrolase [Rhodospirillaceae bacterium]|jgi:glyoxylase-like metal-dependent hydrolase (beta-lactamase superfamily II)|nr:MBL fold metallo-hydrolase [Rhodospirillaceae bacterium]MBT5456700.1 MBL fold metallo-hydrolase [Rhodospirillaceae bacterium]
MSNAEIPFRKRMEFEYGVAEEVTPMVRRMVVRNPSGFTFHGTNTYIIGRGRVAVIDPGPVLDEHLEALVGALEGETVEHIVVTHTHHDHSPGAAPLQNRVGGTLWGARPRALPEGTKTTESIQWDFAPDEELVDGTVVKGDGWTLESIHTPGHMSNHMCFALPEENILFSGDHIMSWNTTIVSPPDGNMREYFDSLEVCLGRGEKTFWPAHGPNIPDPEPFTRAYRSHRRMREGEIGRCLNAGLKTIPEIVERLYTHLPAKMHGAAGRSVFAHLEHMVETGRAKCDGAVTETALYRPV